MIRTGFDIFCRVVDNYGDIGVCWRLARDLRARVPREAVRLWVDELTPFSRLEPRMHPGAESQWVEDVEIRLWTCPLPRVQPHGVVIGAFGSELPAEFVATMHTAGSLWINLEYLSAEDWTVACHGRPSLQASGIPKFFFFPGFTEDTGGLLRESGLLEHRDAWLRRPERKTALMEGLGMKPELLEMLRQGARQVLLFCYPGAPIEALWEALLQDPVPTIVLSTAATPEPAALPSSAGHVHRWRAPFVSQSDFDRLLWASDLNFVRGEDSLVRAIWAGRPMIWQAYPQEDDAHMAKLEAWLERARLPAPVGAAMRLWNGSDSAGFSERLGELLRPQAWPAWQDAARAHCSELAHQADLTDNLLAFCAKYRGTR